MDHGSVDGIQCNVSHQMHFSGGQLVRHSICRSPEIPWLRCIKDLDVVRGTNGTMFADTSGMPCWYRQLLRWKGQGPLWRIDRGKTVQALTVPYVPASPPSAQETWTSPRYLHIGTLHENVP